MRKTVVVMYLLIWFFAYLGITSLSYADSAEVLPKGVSKSNVTYSYYFPIDKRFNQDGDEEDLAINYNTTLDDNVFTALPSGASIGESIASFEYKFTDLIFSFQYGLTDRLSVGVTIPYYWNKNKVEARVDSSVSSSANTGKNTAFDPLAYDPNDLLTYPLIPIAFGGERLSTEDMQNFLGAGLDVNDNGTIDIPGFGYKRFETWSGSGISDIEVGARYQYMKTEDWRLAFTGGVRLPTGDVDDPDNLVDLGFGSGAYALLFRFNNDYLGIKNLVLNATFRYDLVLPDKEVKRVPRSVDQPITSADNKEKVDRDLGDSIELEASASYEFLKGFDFSVLYKYGHGFKDDISGNKGLDYGSLEEETNWTSHLLTAGFSYSTIHLFKAKRFPLPLIVSIEYKNLFAGSNNVLKQDLLSFSLSSFF